jgi:hypothetical protein
MAECNPFQHLFRERLDLTRGDRTKSDRPTVLIQIHAEDFKRRADVPPEHEEVEAADDVMRGVGVDSIQMSDDRTFDSVLLVHQFGVDNQLQRNVLLQFVIIAAKHLAERPFAKDGPNFETIGNVVAHNGPVMVMGVVEAGVRGRRC